MSGDERIRFVADGHVGKLARFLRMLGFDTLYRNDFEDEELVELSVKEGRVLLTQDRTLLKRKEITRGYLVQESDPHRQLEGILSHFNLHRSIRPFARCTLCNTPLEFVPKGAVLDRLPPKVREFYEEFWTCSSCQRIYWKGTHYEHMQKFVEEMVRRT